MVRVCNRSDDTSRGHDSIDIGESEIDSAILLNTRKQLEATCRIRLPDFDVRFSDNIDRACILYSVETRKMPYVEERDLFAKRLKQLRFNGLREYETDNIDHSKLTIFLPKKNISNIR